MGYAIMRSEKRKMNDGHGIELENNRKPEEEKEWVASDIDWSKTNDNYFFIQSDNFRQSIIKELHKHGIDKCRKDAVAFIDTIYTASPEFFREASPEEQKAYFEDCFKFHQLTYGHIINAVVHLDEKTPHMHIISVPIKEKAPEVKYDASGVPLPTKKAYKLSAKEVMGNKAAYSKRQDTFYEKVGKKYGLERGDICPEAKKKHTTALEHKYNQLQTELGATEIWLNMRKEQVAQYEARLEELQSKVKELQEREEAVKSIEKALDEKLGLIDYIQKETARLNFVFSLGECVPYMDEDELEAAKEVDLRWIRRARNIRMMGQPTADLEHYDSFVRLYESAEAWSAVKDKPTDIKEILDELAVAKEQSTKIERQIDQRIEHYFRL